MPGRRSAGCRTRGRPVLRDKRDHRVERPLITRAGDRDLERPVPHVAQRRPESPDQRHLARRHGAPRPPGRDGSAPASPPPRRAWPRESAAFREIPAHSAGRSGGRLQSADATACWVRPARRRAWRSSLAASSRSRPMSHPAWVSRFSRFAIGRWSWASLTRRFPGGLSTTRTDRPISALPRSHSGRNPSLVSCSWTNRSLSRAGTPGLSHFRPIDVRCARLMDIWT